MSIFNDLYEKIYLPNKASFKIVLKIFPSLIYLAVRYPNLVLNANLACPEGPVTLKPDKLPYKIPDYKTSMKSCVSNEKYLRPTYLCNPRDKEIIAMANELGAYSKSQLAYAEAAFKFVNRNIRFDGSAFKSATECLLWGHGTCIDKLSLFIALCRAAGIPGRYRLYQPEVIEELDEFFGNADPLLRKWMDRLGFMVFHGSAEILINGKWIVNELTTEPYHCIAKNVPVLRFGEDPSELWVKPSEDTSQIESLPFFMRSIGKLICKVFGGAVRSFNANVLINLTEGKRLLGDMDIEEYDRKVRATYTPNWHNSARKASDVLAKIK